MAQAAINGPISYVNGKIMLGHCAFLREGVGSDIAEGAFADRAQVDFVGRHLRNLAYH